MEQGGQEVLRKGKSGGAVWTEHPEFGTQGTATELLPQAVCRLTFILTHSKMTTGYHQRNR